ncbi:MAG: hypothetical protein L6455_10755 [Kiritimatiellae bacterium]|nr:hypothetical protein [Kiritimatiellia bacterium]
MNSIFRLKFVFAVILVGLLNFLIITIPALGEQSQNIDGLGISLPSEFKDKLPNHDLLLFANLITSQNDTNKIPRATSSWQFRWLKILVKSKWVDPGILKACEYLSRPLEFKTNEVASPLIQHYGEAGVLYNYQIESYKFTIVDVGERLSFLIRVSGDPGPAGSPLDQVSNIFNVGPDFINTLRSNLVESTGTSFVMMDNKKNGNVIPIGPNIYSRVVYGLFSAKSIFLSFDGLILRVTGRPGTRRVWKDSCERGRFQEQKSGVKEIKAQQSTNEIVHKEHASSSDK